MFNKTSENLEDRIEYKFSKVLQYENLKQYDKAIGMLNEIIKLAEENNLSEFLDKAKKTLEKDEKAKEKHDVVLLKENLESKIKNAKHYVMISKMDEAFDELDDAVEIAEANKFPDIKKKANALIERYEKALEKQKEYSIEKSLYEKIEYIEKLAHAGKYNEAIRRLNRTQKIANKKGFNPIVLKCKELKIAYERLDRRYL